MKWEKLITKWEDIVNQYPEAPVFTGRQRTNIDCPVCGKKIYKRTDIVLTSYPAQYQYECECGWVGYAHV